LEVAGKVTGDGEHNYEGSVDPEGTVQVGLWLEKVMEPPVEGDQTGKKTLSNVLS
jgi:hypothetical protein